MNLGVYLPNFHDQELMKEISECINCGLNNHTLSDASIFFDDISPNKHTLKCGIFNSTELWNFDGVLITTSLSTTLSAIQIVNNISLYYYYGYEYGENVSPLSLIYLLKKPIKIICNSEESKRDYYRKTGVQPAYMFRTFDEMVIGLQQNEY